MNPTTTISPEDEIGFMHIDSMDFTSMTQAQKIRSLEVEGYAIFPQILDSNDKLSMLLWKPSTSLGAHTECF